MDKDELDKLNKQKLFDDGFDPLVLQINDNERDKLAKSLESATDEMKKTLPSDIQSFDRKQKKSRKKKKKKKVSFFHRIIIFIKNLFSEYKFDEDSNISSKEIRRIKQVLTDFPISIFDFKSNKLTENFPMYFFKIFKVLKKLNLLFEESIQDNSEINISEPIFFIRFISNLLSEDAKLKLQVFTNDYLKRLIDTEKFPMTVLKTDLQDFENHVGINERSKLDNYIEPIEKMLTLFSFNFKSFFRNFQESTTDISVGNPIFKAIKVKNMVENIKTLNNYLRIINFEKLPDEFCEAFDDTLFSLKSAEALEENKEEVEELTEKSKNNIVVNKYDEFDLTASDLNEILKDIHTIINKGILECLVRYYEADADYKGKMVKTNVFILDKYLDLLKDKAIISFNKIEQLKREEKISSSICKYFNVRVISDLSAIPNYNEEMNRNLESRSVEKFSGVKKATLTKNFIEKKYTQGIENSIKTVLVEGDFIDKQGQQVFSDAFYKIEQRQSDFIGFQEMVTDGSDEISKIKTFLYSAMHDKNVKTVAKRKIHEIDDICNEIIDDFVIELNSIFGFLEKCLGDSKSSRPDFIYNMKTIGGAGNRTFIISITKSFDEIKGFLDIIKNFVVLHKTV